MALRKAKLRIVSGGQTGADRAALDAAIALNIPAGGWCPADHRAEDGIIPDRYPLRPLPKGGYRARTRKNVQESDGTVICSFGPLTGGSLTTAKDCAQYKKPVLNIDARNNTPTEAALLLAIFVLKHRIQTLNVAGPRASSQPKIYDFVLETLTLMLSAAGKGQSRLKSS